MGMQTLPPCNHERARTLLYRLSPQTQQCHLVALDRVTQDLCWVRIGPHLEFDLGADMVDRWASCSQAAISEVQR